MKHLAILGSTGSIGRQTLEVAQHLGDSEVQVLALAAKSNIELLQQQIAAFSPKVVAVYEETAALELKKRIGSACQVLVGMEGLCTVASLSEVDFVVSAITGAMGLLPTYEALKAGKRVGLANKEVLVAGGEWLRSKLPDFQDLLIPIDSEHSALFQCLRGEEVSSVKRLILTASGGPFLKRPKEYLDKVTVEEALNHPNWKMGSKVTIDSSTLMNKGLEVIEAHYLFNIPIDRLETVIHPQSIIHSMVEFVDHSIIAQMGYPDMRSPIQYAMMYPKRQRSLLAPFDFTKASHLEFYPPNYEQFPCLKMACEALKKSGSATCYLNAANEVLVNRFLKGDIPWVGIGGLLQKLLDRFHPQPVSDWETVIEIDTMARKQAEQIR
jgi:1-deoxy-D-xylulose-5-phosphate reductoisomerase